MALVPLREVTEFIAGQGITLRASAGTYFLQGRLNGAEAELLGDMNKTYGDYAVTERRYFDGSGLPEQPIDPAITVSAVMHISLGTTVYTYLANDYKSYPLNETPKTSLKRVQSSTMSSDSPSYLGGYAYWPEGEGSIAVDGTWGDASAVPADVKEAIIMKAAIAILAGDNVPTVNGVLQNIKSYSTGAYSATYVSGSNDIVATASGWEKRIKDIVGGNKAWRPW